MVAFELSIIFFVGLIASAYGTLIGAGNLLVIPLLVFLGYPIHQALAVNRVGTMGLTLSGYYEFKKKGLVNHKVAIFMAFFVSIGAFIGTKLVIQFDALILEKLVGVIILLMLAFMLLNKDLGIKVKKIGKNNFIVGGILGLFLGIYMGFIGLAAGTLLIYFVVIIFGQTLLQSAATIKIPGFVSSLISVIVFWFAGFIVWNVAIVLFISMLIGSYFGAHYSDRIGNIWLRRLFIFISSVMAIMLLL